MRERIPVAAGGLLLLAASACAQVDGLPPPPLEDAQSLILVVLSAGQPTEAHALSPGDPLPDLRWHRDPKDSLRLALYQEPLAELGIVAGPLDFASSEGEPAPNPDRAFRLDDPSSSWSADDPNAELWDALRVPRVALPCDDFTDFDRRELPILNSEAKGPVFATPYGSSVLVGNRSGVWQVARTSSALVRFEGTSTSTIVFPVVTSSTPIATITRWDRGAIAVYQRGGLLYWGNIRGGFYRMPRRPSTSVTSSAAWVGGRYDGVPHDAFVLEDNGGLWRWDTTDRDTRRGKWTTLIEPTAGTTLDVGGVINLPEPDPDAHNALVLGPMGGQLLLVEGDHFSIAAPSPDSRVTALFQLEREIYVGDDVGRLWKRKGDGGWTLIDAPHNPEVRLIAGFEGGVMFGGRSGFLTYVSSQAPGCHGVISAGSQIFGLSGIGGDDYQMFSSSGIYGDGGPIEVTTLTR